jgi:hypothetical protein
MCECYYNEEEFLELEVEQKEPERVAVPITIKKVKR